MMPSPAFAVDVTLTLGVSYSMRSFCLVGIRNAPPLLLSRHNPLLAGHDQFWLVSDNVPAYAKPVPRCPAHAHLGLRPHTRELLLPLVS